MREIIFKSTIDDLALFRQIGALEALRDSLKESYDYVVEVLNSFNSPITLTQNVSTSQVVSPPQRSKKIVAYNKEWSLADKFLFILMEQNRFLRFREAAKIIITLEGEGDEKDLTDKLSARTLTLKKDGVIDKVQSDSNNVNTFWGFPKWKDEEGKVKQEHMYVLDENKMKRTRFQGILEDLK